MRYICDFHFHSKYSRACSKDLNLANIDQWAKYKGIQIIGTGDFCHPKWLSEIKENLIEKYPGLYQYKGSNTGTLFVLTNEISCIYSQGGKTRRIHVCVLAPNIDFVDELNKRLVADGCNISSDGRPIIGWSAKKLLKTCLEINTNHLTIPAHIWTPWFAIFGSKSGFDGVEECYEELADNIYALETGLSSDPLMNWRLSQLDKYLLVSNSDAHSLQKLGREATVLDLNEPSWSEIFSIFKNRQAEKLLYTIEFYPEEGLYHVDGHRDCKFSCTPSESKRLKNICPKCKKELTIGVCTRVENLADRSELEAKNHPNRPYKSIVPLLSIIADFYGVGVGSKKVQTKYFNIINQGYSEFEILLDLPEQKLFAIVGPELALGIIRVREGKLQLIPGYDGEAGEINIYSNSERSKLKKTSNLF